LGCLGLGGERAGVGLGCLGLGDEGAGVGLGCLGLGDEGAGVGLGGLGCLALGDEGAGVGDLLLPPPCLVYIRVLLFGACGALFSFFERAVPMSSILTLRRATDAEKLKEI